MSDENLMFATEEQQAIYNKQQEVEEFATRKYLTFRTDNLLFGIEAEIVMEIITNYSATYVPMVPSYVRGIINLRGQIIPLLDMRQKLSIEPMDTDCIIVIDVEDIRIGILVDAVSQIIDIPIDTILPVPQHNAQKYVSGMCTMPDNSCTMLVLDCPLLLAN